MSGDVMEFPRTPEKFCEKYSFFDKDEVYTNGSLLIPVFRVEQMVQHYFERMCHIESKVFIEGEYVPCPYYEYWMECGGQFRWDDVEPPTYCPECGGKTVKR